jgi:hypothetical protein
MVFPSVEANANAGSSVATAICGDGSYSLIVAARASVPPKTWPPAHPRRWAGEIRQNSMIASDCLRVNARLPAEFALGHDDDILVRPAPVQVSQRRRQRAAPRR